MSAYRLTSGPGLAFLTRSMRSDITTDIVQVDHCYTRPWSSHPHASNAKPACFLFMMPLQRIRSVNSSSTSLPDIDVDMTIDEKQLPVYNMEKAQAMLSEAERFVDSVRPQPDPNDWEDLLQSQKPSWTVQQNRLFNKVMKILQADNIAKLSIDGNDNAPLLRRVQIDKASRRFRQAMSIVQWDVQLCQWLHSKLFSAVGKSILASYLDVLQSLKPKIPYLIDTMTASSFRHLDQPSDLDALSALLKKKPWNPATNMLTHHKLKKLPGQPLLVLLPHALGAPAGHGTGGAAGSHSGSSSTTSPISSGVLGGTLQSVSSGGVYSRRMKAWSSQLSAMGKLITIPATHTSAPSSAGVGGGVGAGVGVDATSSSAGADRDEHAATTTHTSGLSSDASQHLQHVLTSVRTKLAELRVDYPHRPIILIGWNVGALMACHVSLVEQVTACVCLGLPLTGLDGVRGDIDDPLLNLTTPTLFITGHNSRLCCVDDIEDMREKMRAENSLVIVGGADHMLTVNSTVCKRYCVSQELVDRAIQEEVFDFLGGVISQTTPHGCFSFGDPDAEQSLKKRKRKLSTATSGPQQPESPVKMYYKPTTSTTESKLIYQVDSTAGHKGRHTSFRKKLKHVKQQLLTQPMQHNQTTGTAMAVDTCSDSSDHVAISGLPSTSHLIVPTSASAEVASTISSPYLSRAHSSATRSLISHQYNLHQARQYQIPSGESSSTLLSSSNQSPPSAAVISKNSVLASLPPSIQAVLSTTIMTLSRDKHQNQIQAAVPTNSSAKAVTNLTTQHSTISTVSCADMQRACQATVQPVSMTSLVATTQHSKMIHERSEEHRLNPHNSHIQPHIAPETQVVYSSQCSQQPAVTDQPQPTRASSFPLHHATLLSQHMQPTHTSHTIIRQQQSIHTTHPNKRHYQSTQPAMSTSMQLEHSQLSEHRPTQQSLHATDVQIQPTQSSPHTTDMQHQPTPLHPINVQHQPMQPPHPNDTQHQPSQPLHPASTQHQPTQQASQSPNTQCTTTQPSNLTSTQNEPFQPVPHSPNLQQQHIQPSNLTNMEHPLTQPAPQSPSTQN